MVRLESRDDGSEVSELFVNHKSEDSHHGGTSVVQFDGTLGKLGFLIEGVPSEIDGSGAEVTRELTLAGVVTHDEFKNEDEGDDLSPSSLRDGGKSSVSRRDAGEGGTGVVDVSSKTDSGVVGDESEEGKHGNTSVLDLGVSELVESFLGGSVKHTKRIVESKWWLWVAKRDQEDRQR